MDCCFNKQVLQRREYHIYSVTLTAAVASSFAIANSNCIENLLRSLNCFSISSNCFHVSPSELCCRWSSITVEAASDVICSTPVSLELAVLANLEHSLLISINWKRLRR